MTKDQDHALLLGVAGRLFRERGYAATSLRDIAAAAGMLPGSVHYRFPTKELLLRTLMERGMQRAIHEIRESIDASHDPLERMRLAMRAHLRLLVEGDDAIYVLLYELRSIEHEDRTAIVALRDAYDALWTGLLYAAVGAGQVRTGVDVHLVRLMVIGAINWTAQWYRPDGVRSTDAIADTYCDIMLNGILR